MPYQEPNPIVPTTDPYPVTYTTIPPVTGDQYEYLRRYTTNFGPADVDNLIVGKLWVKNYEIIGGNLDGSNLIAGYGNVRLQVYGSEYISDSLSIGSIDDDGGTCVTSGNNIRLFVGGDTIIDDNLDVRGSCCILGNLQKGSGTFDISHPISEEKRLRHSFVESPRFDNIYRNKVRLSNGKALVDLDIDCVSPGGQTMTPGTWEKLNRNPDIFLQNIEGWSRLKGKINGSILEIECEDENCTDLISWMVVAERQDDLIMNSNISDDEGRLILEYEA